MSVVIVYLNGTIVFKKHSMADDRFLKGAQIFQGLPKFGIFGNFGKKFLPRMLNRGYFEVSIFGIIS